MDKKAQKRVAILRQRVQNLQRMLAGAKSQTDEPNEIKRIEKDLQDAKAEIDRLTGAKPG